MLYVYSCLYLSADPFESPFQDPEPQVNIPVTKEVSGLQLSDGAIVANMAVSSITSSPGTPRSIVMRSVTEKRVLAPILAWLST